MNGVLIVDKPGGITSHDVVDAVRGLVCEKRVGHAGTLDPNATGVLIVLVGKATKVSRFLMGLEKEYKFTVQLGIETDTLDRWGNVVRTQSPDNIGRDAILGAATRFRGHYQQVAPSVSALKHKGTPLYKLARQGKPVPMKTRVVVIDSFEITNIDHPYVTVRTVCSSGTYVRALARDMGRHLGCGACVYSLRRLRVGSFGLADAIPLGDLETGATGVDDVILSIEKALDHLPKFSMTERGVERVKAGGQPGVEDMLSPEFDFRGDYVALTDEKGMIVGIARRSGQAALPLKTERIL